MAETLLVARRPERNLLIKYAFRALTSSRKYLPKEQKGYADANEPQPSRMGMTAGNDVNITSMQMFEFSEGASL